MLARVFSSVAVSCLVPGSSVALVLEAARGGRVSSLIKEIISDSKLSIPLQNVALWELKDGKKVKRVDALSIVDTLDGANLLLDYTGGGESQWRTFFRLLRSSPSFYVSPFPRVLMQAPCRTTPLLALTRTCGTP